MGKRLLADKQAHILLVDDHAVVRAGYRHLLQTQGGYAHVDEAEDAGAGEAAESPAGRSQELSPVRSLNQ